MTGPRAAVVARGGRTGPTTLRGRATAGRRGRRGRRAGRSRARARGARRRPRRPLGPAGRPAPDDPLHRPDARGPGAGRRARPSGRRAWAPPSTSSSKGPARSRRPSDRARSGWASATTRTASGRSPAGSTTRSWRPAGRHRTRPFRPHLTLARSDGIAAGAGFAARLMAEASGLHRRFRVDRVGLVREPDRRRTGAIRAARGGRTRLSRTPSDAARWPRCYPPDTAPFPAAPPAPGSPHRSDGRSAPSRCHRARHHQCAPRLGRAGGQRGRSDGP